MIPQFLIMKLMLIASNGIFGVGGRTVTTRNNQYVPGSSFEEEMKRERTVRDPKSVSRRKVEESQTEALVGG